MGLKLSMEADDLVLRISGRFDFSVRDQFMALVDGEFWLAKFNTMRVDLGAVEYVDSSALGMLLMLRDRVKKLGKDIVLSNPQGAVKEALKIAQFSRLFTID